jgi:plasmid stabilization system protein ParE
MARAVIWSYEATADLEAIADYIARDSTFYAASFVIEVREASRSLNEFSERGRIVPELSNLNIRELFVKEYRLIYSIEESRVVILGLIHGQRDLKSLWEREQKGN